MSMAVTLCRILSYNVYYISSRETNNGEENISKTVTRYIYYIYCVKKVARHSEKLVKVGDVPTFVRWTAPCKRYWYKIV